MKTLKIFLIVMVAIALSPAIAQETPSAPEVVWTQKYNETSQENGLASQGTDNYSMIIAPDGNLVYCTTVGRSHVVGNDIVGGFDVNLSKVDVKTGLQIWSRLYRTYERNSEGNSVKATRDGGYIIAGVTHTPTGGDFLVIKTDEEGELSWYTSFGGVRSDQAYSIIQVEDGYVVCGASQSFNTSPQRYSDIYLVKIDNLGQVQWERVYTERQSRREDEYGFVVERTSDGGYIIGGRNNWLLPGGATLVKTNSFGEMEWEGIYGGTWTKSVVQTPDGGFLTPAAFLEGTGSGKVKLIKVYPDGELEWERTINPYFLTVVESISPTSDGGYLLGGFIQESGSTDPLKAILVKTTSMGYTKWQKAIPVDGENRGFVALQTSDGGYAIGGWSKRTRRSIERDVFVAKLAPEPPAPPTSFIRGDANADTRVDVSDAVFLLSFLFRGGSAPSCLDAGDSNDDGVLDISDAVFTLVCLFGGREIHFSTPYPEVGEDPTADGLGCESYGS